MAVTTNSPVRPRRIEPADHDEHRQLPARGGCLIRLPDVSRRPADHGLSARARLFLEELDRTVFRYLQALYRRVTSPGEPILSFLVRHPKWVAGASLILVLQLVVILLWTDSKPAVIDDPRTIAPPVTRPAAADAIVPVQNSGILPALNLPTLSTPASQSPSLVNPLDGHRVEQVQPSAVAERPSDMPQDCFLPPQARANEAGMLRQNEAVRGSAARMSSRPSRPMLPPPAPVRMDSPAATPAGASLEGRIIPQAGY